MDICVDGVLLKHASFSSVSCVPSLCVRVNMRGNGSHRNPQVVDFRPGFGCGAWMLATRQSSVFITYAGWVGVRYPCIALLLSFPPSSIHVTVAIVAGFSEIHSSCFDFTDNRGLWLVLHAAGNKDVFHRKISPCRMGSTVVAGCGTSRGNQNFIHEEIFFFLIIPYAFFRHRIFLFYLWIL
jgi:hypothetical protein